MEKAIEHRGVEVDCALHQDLAVTLEENKATIADKYPPGSFPRIFYEQQHKASKLKDARAMKWEPGMIRLALAIDSFDIFTVGNRQVAHLYA